MKKEPDPEPGRSTPSTPPLAADELLRELKLEAPELASSFERLPELLPAETVSPEGKARLLADVSELPLRYAPFFEKLASLWDLGEDEVRAELERSKNNDEWRWAALPGIRLFDVRGGSKTASQHVRLVRFAAGVHFPAHTHKGNEKVLILEGSYTDSGGTVYRSGDLHEMNEGSEHGFVIDPNEPCIAAVVEQGREFRSIFLRALSKLVRDG